MGYHLREIPKGVYGELSKIQEELLELEDAIEQGIKIMAMVELSDIYGALEAYAEKNGLTMEDLKKMSDATKRAFRDGSREPDAVEKAAVSKWMEMQNSEYRKPSGARPWPPLAT